MPGKRQMRTCRRGISQVVTKKQYTGGAIYPAEDQTKLAAGQFHVRRNFRVLALLFYCCHLTTNGDNRITVSCGAIDGLVMLP